MQANYLIEIELQGWKPYAKLSLSRWSVPVVGVPVLLTKDLSACPYSYLYNVLLDEYLVTLKLVEINEKEASVRVRQLFNAGWEHRALWMKGHWRYFGDRWFLPESEAACVTEVVQENEKATCEEIARLRATMAEAGEWSEA